MSGGAPNMFDPRWEQDMDHPPFQWRCARLGAQAGAEKLGASVYELPPGASSFPLHIHHANEELLVALAGSPTLRTLDAERSLAPGEVVSFRVGREGAHRIDNRTDDPARILVVSTMIFPEVAEYVDSDKIGVRTLVAGAASPDGPMRMLFRAADQADYFDGET